MSICEWRWIANKCWTSLTRMKKCTYCGKEYPDEATVCERDEQPLIDPNAPKPPPITKPKPNLVGIRGWLLLLAIGLYLGCLIGWLMPAVFLDSFFDLLGNFPVHKGVTTASGKEIPGNFSDFFWCVFCLIYSLAYIGLYIWWWVIAFRFGRKRATTPPTMIKYFKVNFIVAASFLVIGVVGEFYANPDNTDIISDRIIEVLLDGFLGACGSVLIWGNYLKKSKRVKATFVN